MPGNSQEIPNWHVQNTDKILRYFQIIIEHGLKSDVMSERLVRDGLDESPNRQIIHS